MDSNSVQSVNGLLQKLTTESHTLAFLNACDNERRSNKSATSNISVELLIEAWWREIVFELDISFCLGLPRILHYYSSPHLAFKNLLKFHFFLSFYGFHFFFLFSVKVETFCVSPSPLRGVWYSQEFNSSSCLTTLALR